MAVRGTQEEQVGGQVTARDDNPGAVPAPSRDRDFERQGLKYPRSNPPANDSAGPGHYHA
nr:hypothetical protein FFPRI1PSEUD_34640 [Pseudomonas sp. FFPRI_1]